MGTRIFTHNDADAVGCVLVAKRFCAPITSISYNSYQSIDKNLIEFLEAGDFTDTILIADISPSEETCQKLDTAYKQGAHIQLIDHHKTKMWINKYKWAICDDSTACAAKLLLLYYAKNDGDQKFRDLIEAINAWDLWKLGSKHRARGEQLNTLLKFIGKKEFLRSFGTNPSADMESPYVEILSYLEKSKNAYVKRVIKEQLRKTEYRMDDLGNTFKIIFATDYISNIGNAALEDEDSEDLKYVVIINPAYGTCSLRGRPGETDVSAIAQKLGGGGHAAAAGFKIDSKERISRHVANLLGRIDS